MLCLISSLIILGTTPELKCEEPPKIKIVLGESNTQKAEREKREKELAELKERGESYVAGDVKKLYHDNTNNCVAWAKRQTGITRTLGNGARAGIQGTEPKVGAIGAMKAGVHAVVVVAINGDYLTVNESNHTKGWITQRVVNKNQMLGYVYN